MAAPRFVVGVDLRTTNTACAWVDTHAGRAIRVYEVPQLVAPGEMGARPTLPSFVYLAGPHDLPPGSLDLSWTAGRDPPVGRRRGGAAHLAGGGLGAHPPPPARGVGRELRRAARRAAGRAHRAGLVRRGGADRKS